ncbi:hypothetical protein, conserved [Eimeria tenella]|uniref:Uncharacterized protein n=1 Tax=Eimeria tenella TaxID=5802 RepID=U6KYY1_EIMTE|nr:hypothetical protein, conserved [Eimeria tenella]CDJ43171.1 hypothetical protein, conserved [Eimeria tenella]|eukprot:XP_013233921.1 hypothetical protein, conserved [Eimeria tenella]
MNNYFWRLQPIPWRREGFACWSTIHASCKTIQGLAPSDKEKSPTEKSTPETLAASVCSSSTAFSAPFCYSGTWLRAQALDVIPQFRSSISADQAAVKSRRRKRPHALSALADIKTGLWQARCLDELRSRLLGASRRLQHLKRPSSRPSVKGCTAGSSYASEQAETLEEFRKLTPTLAAALRAASDRIQPVVNDVPTRQLLLTCCNLAQRRCCAPSLGAAVLEQLLVQRTPLYAHEAALGVKLSALLLQQHSRPTCSADITIPLEQAEIAQPASTTEEQRGCRPRLVGRRRSSFFRSPAAEKCLSSITFRPSPSRASLHFSRERLLLDADVHEQKALQKLCLLVAVRLLKVLLHNADLRKSLSVRTCVRTAEACALLATQRFQSETTVHSPETFAGAVNVGLSSATGPQLGRFTSGLSRTQNISLPEHVVISSDDLVSSAGEHLAGRALRECQLSFTCPVFKLSVAAAANFDAAAALAMAALWRCLQQSLAPRVATLLLSEAAARQQRDAGAEETPRNAEGWTDGLLGAAMIASARVAVAQTCSTREKLLLQLLSHLQRNTSQRPHLQLLCSQKVPLYKAGEEASQDSLGSLLPRLSHAAICRMSPSTLACVCRSLGSAGTRLSTRVIQFLFDAIRSTLFVHEKSEASAHDDSFRFNSELPSRHSNHEPYEIRSVAGATGPRRNGNDSPWLAARAHSYQALPSTAGVSASYGNWCTVLWASAKILKASCSPFRGSDPSLRLQRLLGRHVLVALIVNLAAAEPSSVAQVAEGLRLLLLIEMKASTCNQLHEEASTELRKPLLLRQRLFGHHELVSILQTLAGHFVQYRRSFRTLEVLILLRLFVQLDLLPSIGISLRPRGTSLTAVSTPSGTLTTSQMEAKCTVLPGLSVSRFLSCALGHQANPENVRALTPKIAECLRSQGKDVFADSEQEASQSLELFTQSLLRAIALKYPEELQRLPKALHQRAPKSGKYGENGS